MLLGKFEIYIFIIVLCYNKINLNRATLDALSGEYEVEAGHGGTRDSYLRDHGIDTFFIVPPAHRRKVMCYLFLQIKILNINHFYLIFSLAINVKYIGC